MSKLRRLLVAIGTAICLAGVASAPASATECSINGIPTGLCAPGWQLVTRTYPTYLPPSGNGTIEIEVFNVGAAASHGAITVTDRLPPGVTATEAGALVGFVESNGTRPPRLEPGLWDCTGNGPDGVQGASVVSCTNDPSGLPEFGGGGGAPATVGPNLQPPIAIAVHTSGEAEGLVNRATIAGGGAPAPASSEAPITVSSKTPPFKITQAAAWVSNQNGTLDTQAGSHPYEATFVFQFASAVERNAKGEAVGLLDAGGEPRNIESLLPPGFVVNPVAVPECNREQFANEECPQASMVGTATVYFTEGTKGVGMQVFNLVPPPGIPAQLGFNFNGNLTFIDGSVRSGGDYGISSRTDGAKQIGISQVLVTLWDAPGEASHNLWRAGEFGGCSQEDIEGRNNDSIGRYCTAPQFPALKPLITVPTACSNPGPTVFRANTWQDEALTAELSAEMLNANGQPSSFTGCEHLQFGPQITIAPDTARADTPSGLSVDVRPPIGGLEEQGGRGSSDIEDTTVRLPKGLVINPGQAAGLQACQMGDVEGGDDLPLPGQNGEEERFAGPAKCPNAAKVGTVTVKTPLLEGAAEKQLEGNIYVLQSNPPDVKLLVAASADGVNLKLVGDVHTCESAGQTIGASACEAPGQLITTFENTPELPFTDFRLSFSGGAQAALDTPAQCGTYGPAQGFFADFQAWSDPFVADVFPTAEFSLSEGPAGGSCPSSPLPFAPRLIAGATSDQAGAFTNFSLLLERGDGQQRIERLQFKAPAGLSGMIASVPLCPEPQAGAGECSSASQIGHATVASGPGPYPLVIPQPGEPESPIYLTGPYEGAPFGLSIVTHVIAGPFNLGTIVTRAKIEVDPHTAQITVTTDPLPQVVAGVPTDLRLIDSVIDRPGFMFNPTNCAAQEFAGTASGTPPPGAGGAGAIAPISSHFGVGSCRELAFTPKFTVATSGNTSKALGASLTAKVSYPAGSMGKQTNIKSVKVDLPKALPSRLTTLQKACTAKAFETNPASCPAESIIGHAVVHTQVLPVPLEGPAYFVSHGGEAFPDLEIVLQGYGVTVDLVGNTDIKGGITSTTFASTPDVPFETFELTLPEGKYSALAAYGSLCREQDALKMPVDFVGQNGLTLKQDIQIYVEGCKPAIVVRSHKVKGKTTTIQVSVPAAGTLVASGKGLSKVSKKAKGASTLTVKLALTNDEAAVLSKHKGRKLKAKINLTFTPKTGKKLKSSTTVIVG